MKVLILGLGSIGKRHARQLLALRPGIELVIADPLADEWGIAERKYTDWERCLRENKDAQAAIVASPFEAHLAQLKALAHWDIPTLLEKPPCALGESRQLAGLIDTRAVVGFNYRLHPIIRDNLENLRLTPRIFFVARQYLTFRYNNTVAETMGAHSVDLANYILGPGDPEQVYIAQDGRTFRGQAGHPNGLSYYAIDMLHDPREAWIMAEGIGMYDLPPDEDMYRDQMMLFLDYAEGKGLDPRLATIQDGVNCMRVLEAAKCTS